MTSKRLDEWFWAMFEETPTLLNVIFDTFFIWIGYNNYQIWVWYVMLFQILLAGEDFTLFHFWSTFHVNWGKFLDDLISRLVDLLYEPGQMMTRYDFLEARWLILSNVRMTPTWHDFTLGQLCIWFGIYQIMTRYNIREARWVILSNVWTDSNLT